jgi:rubrerythrin
MRRRRHYRRGITVTDVKIPFRESRTAHNLLLSFSAEAQARTRYNFFAERAREEGYIQVARLFDETAAQEYEHALRFFKFFNGGWREIGGSFPAGVIEDTYSNLISSAELERYVHDEMYAKFARKAEEEGLIRAADTFDAINIAENQHRIMFSELADNIQTGLVFSRPEERIWKCLSCGYLHHGSEPPDKCPACVKPRGYFELLGKNW